MIEAALAPRNLQIVQIRAFDFNVLGLATAGSGLRRAGHGINRHRREAATDQETERAEERPTDMGAERTPVIAGNWKMNGLKQDGLALARDVAAGAGTYRCEFVVCPPATLLAAASEVLVGSGVHLGAQDCHAEPDGAHTGDISAAMLVDAGCSHAILGHSERRADHGEDDATVLAKATAALAAGLTAIVCVGETEAERDAGQALDVVAAQVAGSVPENATAANTIVAYEPVWAIGSGRTPTPSEIQAVHAHIRSAIADRLDGGAAAAMRLLYGGSMKPGNAAELLAIEDVDGGLIGGASLKAEDFLAIAQSCP